MYPPLPNYDYLLGLVDDTGIYEHSRYGVPRRDHGYTVDDAARAIVVLCSSPGHPPVVRALRALLSFLLDAMTGEGRFRNRLSFDRRWVDEPGSDDTQGRAIWALAVAATRAPRPDLRGAASSALSDVPALDTPHLRPHAFAALGAHALWRVDPSNAAVSRFVEPAVRHLSPARDPWPETRLTYANGRIPAGMLAAGEVVDDPSLTKSGLEMLTWLVETETREAHLSFTPVGGWSNGEPRPAFDQQPIEAAALADAAERAWWSTGDRQWHDVVRRSATWLMGENDVGVPLYDAATGATFDGLMEDAANANSGAESTIAGLSILQTWHWLEAETRSGQDSRAKTHADR